MEAVLLSPLGRTVLASAVVSIGRTMDNHLVINDAKVASHHAELRLVGEGYSITDLASTSGTFVNAQRLASNVPHPLTTDDMLRIGNTTFRYEVRGGAQAVSTLPSVAPTDVTSAMGELAYPSTLPATAPTYAPAPPQAPVSRSGGSTEVPSSTGESTYPSTPPATAPTFAAAPPQASVSRSVGSTEVPSSRVPVQPKKMSRWWLWVVLAIIAVAVLTAIITLIVLATSSPSPTQTLDTFRLLVQVAV